MNNWFRLVAADYRRQEMLREAEMDRLTRGSNGFGRIQVDLRAAEVLGGVLALALAVGLLL